MAVMESNSMNVDQVKFGTEGINQRMVETSSLQKKSDKHIIAFAGFPSSRACIQLNRLGNCNGHIHETNAKIEQSELMSERRNGHIHETNTKIEQSD
jgi:hypothetical protein